MLPLSGHAGWGLAPQPFIGKDPAAAYSYGIGISGAATDVRLETTASE